MHDYSYKTTFRDRGKCHHVRCWLRCLYSSSEAQESSQPDFVSWLMHMLEGSPLDIEDDESSKNCAAGWVNISNRGGLLILHCGAYWLFRDVELLLWLFVEK